MKILKWFDRHWVPIGVGAVFAVLWMLLAEVLSVDRLLSNIGAGLLFAVSVVAFETNRK